MMLAAGFSWFDLWPSVGHDELFSFLGVHEENELLCTAWSVCLALVAFALIARRSLEGAWARPGLEKYYPDERATLRGLVEAYAAGLHRLVEDVIGRRDTLLFFSLIASLFTYIVCCNLLALVPGFQPPTDNVNNNVGMALLVFFLFNTVGLMRDPVGYIKHLWGPVWWVGPLLFTIEVIGLCVRPVSLTLRLTGNIFGDHTVFNVVSDLTRPVWFLPIPAAFLALGLLVSFIQAFVFSLLTTIYIGLASPHDEHDEAHH